MRALSTYLGHVDIANTYWYLEATPVLLQMIAARAEETWIGVQHDPARAGPVGFPAEASA
ncbi:hypothetical protein [Frigidibacter mobilis]|uniref:hypothetical protein n=1 Tax=Frigidibacter mobilis TaxID=1335048 RepID=UPI000ADF0840|nr:hypothetical protein [Frigidibacter mobilis]